MNPERTCKKCGCVKHARKFGVYWPIRTCLSCADYFDHMAYESHKRKSKLKIKPLGGSNGN